MNTAELQFKNQHLTGLCVPSLSTPSPPIPHRGTVVLSCMFIIPFFSFNSFAMYVCFPNNVAFRFASR